MKEREEQAMELSYDFDGVEYNYRVRQDDVLDVISKEIENEYKLDAGYVKKLIEDENIEDIMINNHIETIYEYYRERAYEEFLESKQDIYSYYGLDRRDF